MTLRSRIWLLSGSFLLVNPVVRSAASQSAPRLTASATAANISAHSTLPGGSADLGGRWFGGEGALTWRRLALRVAYSQGTLGFDEWSFNAPSSDNSGGGVVGVLLRGPFDSDEASAAPVDLNMAEGLVSLGLNAFDGLELGAGVRGRARYTGSDSERILLLVAHARYEAPVISERVWAFVEGWNSLAGDASAPSGSASGKGGLVGVVAALGPLAVRLSFAADAARYANAARRDELQSFALGLGYNLR